MPTPTVTYTTPDGVERVLRFTLGARRRIAERFKEPNVMTIITKIGDGALPEIAYCMMYDEEGNPPAGLLMRSFQESVDDATPILAAVMSAVQKGAVPPNELEAMLRKAQQEMAEKALIGSAPGVSPDIASDSPLENSGS